MWSVGHGGGCFPGPASWRPEFLEPESHSMIRLVCSAALCLVTVSLCGCQKVGPPTGAEPVAPAVKVKAGDLLKEYSTNAVAADAKYKDKVIQVSGKFGSAQPVPLYGYAVQLLPEDAGDVNLSGVQCFIVESAQADVEKLQPMQPITMQGTCGGAALGQVKMSKCTLVK
jgi:tRNA_anti-like